MKKSPKIKQEFVETLKEARTMTRACKKCGLGRSTVDEWMKEDIVFKRDVHLAIIEAKRMMCDMAENIIIDRMAMGDIKMAKYVLQHHHKEYGATSEYAIDPTELLFIDPSKENQEFMKILRARRAFSDLGGTMEGTQLDPIPFCPDEEEDEEDSTPPPGDPQEPQPDPKPSSGDGDIGGTEPEPKIMSEPDERPPRQEKTPEEKIQYEKILRMFKSHDNPP